MCVVLPSGEGEGQGEGHSAAKLMARNPESHNQKVFRSAGLYVGIAAGILFGLLFLGLFIHWIRLSLQRRRESNRTWALPFCGRWSDSDLPRSPRYTPTIPLQTRGRGCSGTRQEGSKSKHPKSALPTQQLFINPYDPRIVRLQADIGNSPMDPPPWPDQSAVIPADDYQVSSGPNRPTKYGGVPRAWVPHSGQSSVSTPDLETNAPYALPQSVSFRLIHRFDGQPGYFPERSNIVEHTPPSQTPSEASRFRRYHADPGPRAPRPIGPYDGEETTASAVPISLPTEEIHVVASGGPRSPDRPDLDMPKYTVRPDGSI